MNLKTEFEAVLISLLLGVGALVISDPLVPADHSTFSLLQNFCAGMVVGFTYLLIRWLARKGSK